MRRLLTASIRCTFTGHVGFSRNVLGKYPNNGSPKHRPFVEKARGRLLDLFPEGEKQSAARATFRSLHPSEFVKGSIADLAQDDLVSVEHGKPERVPFLVMPLDFVTNQRHGQHSDTDAGRQKCPALQDATGHSRGK